MLLFAFQTAVEGSDGEPEVEIETTPIVVSM